MLHGKRIQESTGSTSKTVAKEFEKRRREDLERAAVGMSTSSPTKAMRIRSVAEWVNAYLNDYGLTHRASSELYARNRLAHVARILGSTLLSDLTEQRVRDYIRQRQAEGVSGRTINMELGELSRAIGKTWRELWPRVKKLEERKDVGRALSLDEQQALLNALATSRSQVLKTLIPVLLLTGMRSGEATTMRWSQVDLNRLRITVGRSKTSAGTGRVIPINEELAKILSDHRAWFRERFGDPHPEHCVFPFGHPVPTDPSKSVTDVTWAWDDLRRRSAVSCRLHDLRHTFATGLAEHGTSESTMLALLGHMSRAMLELYSHIRMTAKIEAVSAISLKQKGTLKSDWVPVKVPVA